MTTVALYARVSTKDKGQSTENQLSEQQCFAPARGYTIHEKNVERNSSGTSHHSKLQALFADAILTAANVS